MALVDFLFVFEVLVHFIGFLTDSAGFSDSLLISAYRQCNKSPDQETHENFRHNCGDSTFLNSPQNPSLTTRTSYPGE
jgi:hypothetical protein